MYIHVEYFCRPLFCISTQNSTFVCIFNLKLILRSLIHSQWLSSFTHSLTHSFSDLALPSLTKWLSSLTHSHTQWLCCSLTHTMAQLTQHSHNDLALPSHSDSAHSLTHSHTQWLCSSLNHTVTQLNNTHSDSADSHTNQRSILMTFRRNTEQYFPLQRSYLGVPCVGVGTYTVLRRSLDTRDFMTIDLTDTVLASVDYLKFWKCVSSKLTHCRGLSGKPARCVSQSCLLPTTSVSIESQAAVTP